MEPIPPRVAYSFQAGTFDLRRWCPGLWQMGEDARSILVRLDARWEDLFNALNRVGGLLVSVRSGPIQGVRWLQNVDFARLPGSDEMVELNSNTQVRTNVIGSAMVVVEECKDQQLASLQFFTRDGSVCLKILLTQQSNASAFESLVMSHARPSSWMETLHKEEPICCKIAETEKSKECPLERCKHAHEIDATKVRQLWKGMWRTRPGRYFPGLGMVSRLSAISAVGDDLAKEMPVGIERSILNRMLETNIEMEFLVRNLAVSMPIQTKLVRSSRRGCGETFFGRFSQITLRCCCEQWAIWMLRVNTSSIDYSSRLEIYDSVGEFSGSISKSERMPI